MVVHLFQMDHIICTKYFSLKIICLICVCVWCFRNMLSFQFLTKLHLMDYSMLVGIHDMAQAEEEALLNENANRDAAAGRETSESEECESGEKYVQTKKKVQPKFNRIQPEKLIERNFFVDFLALGARIIHHQIHPDAWDSITTSFKRLIFMHYTVLKVSSLSPLDFDLNFSYHYFIITIVIKKFSA